jgi:hypothetical protein
MLKRLILNDLCSHFPAPKNVAILTKSNDNTHKKHPNFLGAIIFMGQSIGPVPLIASRFRHHTCQPINGAMPDYLGVQNDEAE